MKTYHIIICIIISFVLASCFSKNYRIITRIERNGSCQGEYLEIRDSINSNLFSHFHSSGWEISHSDTILSDNVSIKTRKNVRISKNFKSVEELSADTARRWYRLTPKESLKKHFRWFYTCYVFTAVYPEVTCKGSVPMEKYMNRDEQRFYLQGDMSAYRGMNGWELREKIDEIEEQFMKWYYRTIYEESFDIILQFAAADFRLKLPAVKDSLYSINKKQLLYKEMVPPTIDDICKWLDSFFVADCFSKLYFENGSKMNDMFEAKMKEVNELLNYGIQYELTLPGTIITTNADMQNDGLLAWKINMLKFLAEDYILTAESRTVNVWAFAVTLLLLVFSVYCFSRKK